MKLCLSVFGESHTFYPIVPHRAITSVFLSCILQLNRELWRRDRWLEPKNHRNIYAKMISKQLNLPILPKRMEWTIYQFNQFNVCVCVKINCANRNPVKSNRSNWNTKYAFDCEYCAACDSDWNCNLNGWREQCIGRIAIDDDYDDNNNNHNDVTISWYNQINVKRLRTKHEHFNDRSISESVRWKR